MLKVGAIISYNTMCKEENSSLQRGMNFHLNNSTSVILISVRSGAPYQDSIQDEGKVLIYEGHNVPRKKGSNIDPKSVDQTMYTEYGYLTENGKFYNLSCAKHWIYFQLSILHFQLTEIGEKLWQQTHS